MAEAVNNDEQVVSQIQTSLEVRVVCILIYINLFKFKLIVEPDLSLMGCIAHSLHHFLPRPNESIPSCASWPLSAPFFSLDFFFISQECKTGGIFLPFISQQS